MRPPRRISITGLDKKPLKVAGKEIDFVSLHWYTAATTESSGWKDIDNTGTLLKTQDELPENYGRSS